MIALANKGWKKACKENPALALGLNIVEGKIVYKAVEPIQLDEIANIVGLSKSICCKEFKKVMGYTIFNYLMNYRLIMATKLLLQTDESITEIAYKTGFSNSSYFIKNFKLKTGKSPSSYRKEHKSSKQDILTSL